MADLERQKQISGETAAKLVESGMTVGAGQSVTWLASGIPSDTTLVAVNNGVGRRPELRWYG